MIPTSECYCTSLFMLSDKKNKKSHQVAVNFPFSVVVVSFASVGRPHECHLTFRTADD